MNTNENTFTRDIELEVSCTLDAFEIARGADNALAELAGFLTDNGKNQMSADYYWNEFRPAYIAAAEKRGIETKSAERDFQRNMARMRTMSDNGDCCRFETPAKPKKQTTAAQKMRARRANVSPEEKKALEAVAKAKAARIAAEKKERDEMRKICADIDKNCKRIKDIKKLRMIRAYTIKRLDA